MGRYIQYKRISKILSAKELDQILLKIIEDGMEIISYRETILEKNERLERLAVSIICGKLNEGTSQLLKS